MSVTAATLQCRVLTVQDRDRSRPRPGDSTFNIMMRTSDGGSGRDDTIRISSRIPLILQVSHISLRASTMQLMSLAQWSFSTHHRIRRDCSRGDRPPHAGSWKVSCCHHDHTLFVLVHTNALERCTRISVPRVSPICHPNILINPARHFRHLYHVIPPINHLTSQYHSPDHTRMVNQKSRHHSIPHKSLHPTP